MNAAPFLGQMRWGGIAVVIVLLFGCSREPADRAVTTTSELASTHRNPAHPWFTNIVSGSGLSFIHHSGASGRFWLPEMESGGVGLLDYDGDGLLDVFCVDGGSLDPDRPAAPARAVTSSKVPLPRFR